MAAWDLPEITKYVIPPRAPAVVKSGAFYVVTEGPHTMEGLATWGLCCRDRKITTITVPRRHLKKNVSKSFYHST